MNDTGQTQEAYLAQIRGMAERAKAWRRDHPTTLVSLQMNLPGDVLLISTVGQAFKNGFLSVNEAGREFVAAVVANDQPEPTLLMLRAAIEVS